ncbi:hypothetical protein SAMN04489712_11365 [Thermomonospora echinospora]|uniref:Guanylate cyclase domain-containing protein n=1 Tax=Thermomonospora echinospora TaxID=1992 RepID=A0A1H6D6C6_9ACTN|nr:hypothetical protein [Thermomonospora echinospora]SEG80343.1 hypothetical protein SAMN04489712_11365 [Thermomonospora echinospora]
MNDLAENLAENLSQEPAGRDDQLVYRLLVAVDIQGYSKRDTREQLHAQRDLSQALDRAAAGAGLDRARWDKQVGGDGELAMLPEDADLAPVVGDFPLLLAAGLRALNRERSGRPRLRIRLAVHHGTLTAGPFGPAGDAPIVVQRLLDAVPLRRLLADEPERDLAYMVSDSLYADVVRTGFTRMAPGDFQAVKVTAKGAAYRGHIHIGDPIVFADLGELHDRLPAMPPLVPSQRSRR